MEVRELPLTQLHEAPWNPNVCPRRILVRLRRSIEQFGIVEPLVVRSVGRRLYEVVNGNHRLRLFTEAKRATAPCVIVKADDTQARLLAQALNRLHGEDQAVRRSELLGFILGHGLKAEDVAGLLPDSPQALAQLAEISERLPEGMFGTSRQETGEAETPPGQTDGAVVAAGASLHVDFFGCPAEHLADRPKLAGALVRAITRVRLTPTGEAVVVGNPKGKTWVVFQKHGGGWCSLWVDVRKRLVSLDVLDVGAVHNLGVIRGRLAAYLRPAAHETTNLARFRPEKGSEDGEEKQDD